MRRVLFFLVGIAVVSVTLLAQTPANPAFDVASIKPNNSGPEAGMSVRTMPDGTFMMVNGFISTVIRSAAAVPVREVVGLPTWANTERYDITTKPPAGSTAEERRQMWQGLFAERMKLGAHVEEREQDTFALVIARSDGRLGPQLMPSTLDCGPRPPGSAPPPPLQIPVKPTDFLSRCGSQHSLGSIVAGGITLDNLALSLGGIAGRLVTNRTGLQGFYRFTLKFSPPRRPGGIPADTAFDDAPEIFTALQEQLGLKLQPEKTMVPFFVIDHIERPTEN